MAVDPVTAGQAMLRSAERLLARKRERASQARDLVPALARTCSEAGATRVVLFGSLVTGDINRGDIDLAVEGVPGDAFFHLLGRLLDQALPFSVDLTRLEDAPRSLRERVEAEGEVLVDRG